MYPESNWLLVSAMDESKLCDYGWHQSRQDNETAVRFVRGHKMRDLDSLFDEVAAAFQFPYYFGENYDAFSECLSDLSWIKQTRILMFITRFEEVLADEPIERVTFGRALKDAATEYNRPRSQAEKSSSASFRVILNSRFGIQGIPEEFIAAAGKPEALRIESSP